MRLRSESKGCSCTRGLAASSRALSSPPPWAASTNAVSVGSPSHWVPGASPSVCACLVESLHSAAARRASAWAGPGRGSPGTQRTPWASSSSACMRFWVRVPVLSEQMVVTEPSVPTDGRRRTSACTATMRRAPRASSTVTTAGNASGMAATARLMAVRAMSSGASPRSTPTTKITTKITAQMPSTAIAKRLPNAARRSCSGMLRSPVSSSVATLPSSVCMPVATTSPRARPWVAVVPLKAKLVRSPSAPTSSAARGSVCLATVTDSPVRADSSTCSCAMSMSRRSAGIWLPASSSTMSPGTSTVAGTTCTSPPRSTVACAAASWRSAAMTWSARQACTKPMTALSATMTRITSVSVTSPTRPEMTAAPSSTSTMKSLNC